jgi:NAD(P)H-nitrite reductase large subunit
MLVCSCMSVTRGTIVEAVQRDDLADVDAVAEATGAGSGCGTCRRHVASLLRGSSARR